MARITKKSFGNPYTGVGQVTNKHLISEIKTLDKKLDTVTVHTTQFDRDLKETRRIMYFLLALVLAILSFGTGIILRFVFT